ncbi:MAG: hypothetical protein AB8H80_09825 [Planctomycetota bacterium]
MRRASNPSQLELIRSRPDADVVSLGYEVAASGAAFSDWSFSRDYSGRGVVALTETAGQSVTTRVLRLNGIMGDPAAATIPLNLGASTLGIEVDNFAGAAVIITTVADGGGQYSLDVPNNPLLFGQVFGFQYFWADNTPCSVAHTEGLVVTVGS